VTERSRIKITRFSFLLPIDVYAVNLKFAFCAMLLAVTLSGASLSALCSSAEAQEAEKVPKIGYLVSGSRADRSTLTDAFHEGLRELGYVEGKTIVIEYRYGDAKPDRLPGLASELVRLKVDTIVVAGGAAPVRAAKNATETIPIVMLNVIDPVARGFVASLARPGGNITGLSTLAPEVGGKRLELLREMIPKLLRVAVIGVSTAHDNDPEMKAMEVAARVLGVQLESMEVRGSNDLESIFSEIARRRTGALIGLQTASISNLRKQIAERAVKSRIPAVSYQKQFADDGWLLSYGPDFAHLYRRAATYVDKILKGAKPSDLPVEQPTKFELVINLKTAKQIGLTIPPNLLARADRVIR
jgi:putative tryptophan/tyrosine transport system substrate-binding protein